MILISKHKCFVDRDNKSAKSFIYFLKKLNSTNQHGHTAFQELKLAKLVPTN